MAENDVVQEVDVISSAESAKPSKVHEFVAGVKEWFRKFIVKLKRKTQLIPLVLILISSLIYLCIIGTLSQVVEKNTGIDNLGISMFVNTLVSILILPTFLNAFPKRKKPNIVYIVAVFVLLALIIGMDLLYYINTSNFIDEHRIDLSRNPEIQDAYNSLIIHVVFVAIAFVAFAFMPLYKKGINMINTSKVLEENKLSDEIDTSAEV